MSLIFWVQVISAIFSFSLYSSKMYVLKICAKKSHLTYVWLDPGSWLIPQTVVLPSNKFLFIVLLFSALIVIISPFLIINLSKITLISSICFL